MIEFKNIQKKYDNGNVVLKNINLTCETGKITVLIGPSGCGKTTTMKLINRLINPTNGSVFIDGEDISNINPVELRRKIGYVIQHIGLFPHMTIAQNVSVVPRLLKWDKNKIEKRVDELMELAGLDPKIYKNRYPSELSGGQQQRIGVIRALAAEPSIVLMDEPFSALDPISREQLQEELNKLQREINKTIVFVTHDMDEALKIADKIVIMKDGEIVQADSPENILRHPANDFVRDFIGKKRLKESQEKMTVADVMITEPISIYPYRGLAMAMSLMEKKSVDSLVVVNEQNEIQGYISIYDVVRNFADESKKVADIVQPFSHVITKDTLLEEAVHLLHGSNLSYLPVINEENYLCGLLTRGCIVGHMKDIYTNSGSKGA